MCLCVWVVLYVFFVCPLCVCLSVCCLRYAVAPFAERVHVSLRGSASYDSYGKSQACIEKFGMLIAHRHAIKSYAQGTEGSSLFEVHNLFNNNIMPSYPISSRFSSSRSPATV